MDVIPFVGDRNNRVCFIFGKYSDIRRALINLIKETIDKDWQFRDGEINETIIKNYLNLKQEPTQIKCIFWPSNTKNTEVTVFLTTMPDGWQTLINMLVRDSKFKIIRVTFSGNDKALHFASFQESINNFDRLIQVYYDFNKWVFYEEGEVLSIENKMYYLQRKIKERLTNSIIVEYLLKSGIDIFDRKILERSEFVEMVNINNTP